MAISGTCDVCGGEIVDGRPNNFGICAVCGKTFTFQEFMEAEQEQESMKKKHKRVDVGPEYNPKKMSRYRFNAFCCCPHCFSELAGDWSFFETDMSKTMDIPYFTVEHSIECPVCHEMIYLKPENYINVSMQKLKHEALFGENKGLGGKDRFEVAKGYNFWYDPNAERPVVKAYHIDQLGKLPNHSDMDMLISLKTIDDYKMDQVFDVLRKIRQFDKKAQIPKLIEAIDQEAEKQIVETRSIDIAAVKENVETLKEYILHLINVESSIYSCNQRLTSLYEEKIELDEDYTNSKYTVGEKEEAAVNEAKKLFDTLPTEADFSNRKPKEPKAPVKPNLEQPGLFNKKKVLAENERKTRLYEDEKKQYDVDYKSYQKALDAFKKEVEQKIEIARNEVEKKVKEAETALKNVRDNTSETPEYEKKKLIDIEIETAKNTLFQLAKCKNELYALDIIYGKYRNFIALSSIYEYLISGRTTSLEGANGAYNIYENEVRTNQIISQLSEVLNSLEQIKTNQFMAYSKLQTISSDLQDLNKSTTRAVKMIDRMGADVSNIAQNSSVIAYNTEQTAYYAKKNKELTDALGFMVALK